MLKMELTLQFNQGELAEFIRLHYPNKPTRLLSLVTGFTENKIYRMAASLGLKKTEEHQRQTLQRLAVNLSENGKAHRFTAGQTPPNKGKRMPAEVYEKAKATMFKPGHKPHNTKHDGHISIRRDKTGREYAWVRVREGEYRLLHRVVWEENNGPIPRNMVVTFKNGNTMDCILENLELLTKEQNMLRNSMLRYAPDMVQAIRLKGALKRRIRNIEERW